MKIAAIGDEDTVIGLKIAGIDEGIIIKDPTEAEASIKRLANEGKTGLIIITEKTASKIRRVINEINKKHIPIILEIPDKNGPLSEEDPVGELIRKAIGVDIKIKNKNNK